MDEIDFPIICAECGCYVWNSTAITYNGMTYCEECASDEPGEDNE